jgi:hypothetical protein
MTLSFYISSLISKRTRTRTRRRRRRQFSLGTTYRDEHRRRYVRVPLRVDVVVVVPRQAIERRHRGFDQEHKQCSVDELAHEHAQHLQQQDGRETRRDEPRRNETAQFSILGFSLHILFETIAPSLSG